MQKIVILGCGGFGRDVLDVVLAEGIYEVVGWIVDPKYASIGTIINEHLILGGFDWLEGKRDKVKAISAGGSSELRRSFAKSCSKYGISFATTIHPSASISRWATIGEGVIISEYCTVRCQGSIGNFCAMNINSVIGHDGVMEDYSTLAMGVKVTGNCIIKEGAYIGSGVTFVGAKTVGRWTHVGAGTVVTMDVPDNATVVGVPSKVVKMREEGWYESFTDTTS